MVPIPLGRMTPKDPTERRTLLTSAKLLLTTKLIWMHPTSGKKLKKRTYTAHLLKRAVGWIPEPTPNLKKMALFLFHLVAMVILIVLNTAEYGQRWNLDLNQKLNLNIALTPNLKQNQNMMEYWEW